MWPQELPLPAMVPALAVAERVMSVQVLKNNNNNNNKLLSRVLWELRSLMSEKEQVG